MAIGIVNKDMSFFAIDSDEVNLSRRAMSKDVLSLSITEEVAKMDTGTISFHDPNHFYSRILRTGTPLRIAWGYATFGQDIAIPQNLFNSDIFTRNLERRGLQAWVMAPSGGGDDQGRCTYDCNFQAMDLRGRDDVVRYTDGNKGDVIAQIMDRLGISALHRDINFHRMKEPIEPSTEVIQWESDFRTLVRLSYEWRAAFKMGFAGDGSPVGIFVDPWAIGDSPATKSLSGVSTNVFFNYRGGGTSPVAVPATVISYKWRDQSGESGVGDNVQMRWVGGKPVFIHYVAATQTVTAYEINEDAMRAELDRQDNLGDQAAVLGEWIKARTFKEVERYFKPVTQETAPQGTGIVTEIQTIGSPMFTAGLKAELGPGFPERLRQKGVVVYINKVVHRIGADYMCDHELWDSYVYSPTGQVILNVGLR